MTSGTLLKITPVWVISCPVRRLIINRIYILSAYRINRPARKLLQISAQSGGKMMNPFSEALSCFAFIISVMFVSGSNCEIGPVGSSGTRSSVMMKVKKRARMSAKPLGLTLLLRRGVLPNVTFISAEAAVGMQPPKASPAFWQAASLASGGAVDAFIMWELWNVAPDRNEDSGGNWTEYLLSVYFTLTIWWYLILI